MSLQTKYEYAKQSKHREKEGRCIKGAPRTRTMLALDQKERQYRILVQGATVKAVNLNIER
jgi:hypothetical protein